MKSGFFRKKWFWVIGLCLVCFVGGVVSAKIFIKPTIIKNTVLRESGFKYINPVLLCNTNNDQKYNENTSLSQKLQDYAAGKPGQDISAYYLSLTGKGWAAVNKDTPYSPASMLKIPTIVDVLKFAETHPDILSKKILYKGDFDYNTMEDFKPASAIQAGHSYSISDLIPYIVNYSDNNALHLVHGAVGGDALLEIYRDLKIDPPSATVDFMSARTYALFLRVLYNSTYLTRESSERVLELMAHSDFPNGLVAGVPSGVEVAHKFGERQTVNPDGSVNERELHDCGIVYAQNGPYIICVMTRGLNFNDLMTDISDISRVVYGEVGK